MIGNRKELPSNSTVGFVIKTGLAQDVESSYRLYLLSSSLVGINKSGGSSIKL